MSVNFQHPFAYRLPNFVLTLEDQIYKSGFHVPFWTLILPASTNRPFADGGMRSFRSMPGVAGSSVQTSASQPLQKCTQEIPPLGRRFQSCYSENSPVAG